MSIFQEIDIGGTGEKITLGADRPRTILLPDDGTLPSPPFYVRVDRTGQKGTLHRVNSLPWRLTLRGEQISVRRFNQPSAPTETSAEPISESSVDYNFTIHDAGHDGVEIHHATVQGGPYSLLETVGEGDSPKRLTGLAQNTTHYFVSRSFIHDGPNTNFSDFSDEASATTSGAAVPAAPTNLSAPRTSDTVIEPAWTDNSDNETGFHVYRKFSRLNEDGTTYEDSDFTKVETTDENVTSFEDINLAAYARYIYEVTAFNAEGESDPAGPVTTDPSAPQRITGVSADAGNGLVTLDADSVGSRVDKISVERKTTGSFSEIDLIDRTALPYEDDTVSNDTTYTYRLIARNLDSDADASEEVEATPTGGGGGGSGDFPNEPAGTVLTDVGWSSLSPSGWNVEASGSWFGGDVRIDGTQSGEPQTPPDALEMLFPANETDLSGRAPARARFAISPRTTDLYAAWTWRPSDPWTQHPSGVDKKAFLFHGDGEGQWVMSWHFTGQVKILFQRGGWGSTSYHAHNISSLPSDRGNWYFFEQRLTKLQNLADGEAEWRWRLWASEYDSSGNLLKSHALRADHNIVIGTQVGIQTWSWEPTWGGTGDHAKAQDDFFWWGHTKLVDAG